MTPQGPIPAVFRALFQPARAQPGSSRYCGTSTGRGRLQRGRGAARSAQGRSDLPQPARAVRPQTLVRHSLPVRTTIGFFENSDEMLDKPQDAAASMRDFVALCIPQSHLRQ